MGKPPIRPCGGQLANMTVSSMFAAGLNLLDQAAIDLLFGAEDFTFAGHIPLANPRATHPATHTRAL